MSGIQAESNSPAYARACAPTLDAFQRNAISVREEEGASSFPSSNSSHHETSTEALRALVSELRQLGVRDPAERLREAALKIGQRVIDAMQTDPAKSPRWAEVVLRDGASQLREPGPQLSLLDRRRIASFDALYQDRTGKEWPTA